MKNSWQLNEASEGIDHFLLQNDRCEIDCKNHRTMRALSYHDRIRQVISRVKQYCPVTGVIGDFGCAQANISMLLAEQGYESYAIDTNDSFLRYAQLKYEKGIIHWIRGRIDNVLAIPAESLDVAIMGEIVEHCAFPEQVIARVLRYLKPNGLLIITTPNGSRIKTTLATYNSLKQEERLSFAEKQFGPRQDDHLFLFTLSDLCHLNFKDLKVIEKGYVGTSRLITNRCVSPFLQLIPLKILRKVIRLLTIIPLINKKTCEGIYVIYRKEGNPRIRCN